MSLNLDHTGFPATFKNWLLQDCFLVVCAEIREVTEADHSLPSSAKVKECVELYLHSPVHWRGAQLKKSTGITYYNSLYN
jgi:hypothetical protein